MKKVILLLALLSSIGFCFAQLEMNIPFDTNVVGQAWNGTNYTFQSEYFYVTNIGTSVDYTITVTSFDLPEDWNLMWCHEIEGEGGCNFLPSLTIEFPQNEVVKLDFILAPVASAAGCHIQFKFESESLAEPEYIMFFFRTEDAANTEENELTIPAIKLHQNYPNPFNPMTTISFYLPQSEIVDLSIFNLTGQKVVTLLAEHRMAGNHDIVWNGKDMNGFSVSSGTYFYKLSTSRYTTNRKMILMK